MLFEADAFELGTFYDGIANTSESFLYGYLNVKTGTLWLLVNGTWQLIGSGSTEITVEPGHMLIEVDNEVFIPEQTYIVDGYNVSIGGSITADDAVLEIFWDIETRSVIFNCDADMLSA